MFENFLAAVRMHPFISIGVAVFISQSASAMPSPTLTGQLSSPFYKWLFGTMHIFVAIPRIIITLFPQFAWLFGVNAANKSLQATDKAALLPDLDAGIVLAANIQALQTPATGVQLSPEDMADVKEMLSHDPRRQPPK
jgi:hypothetical protein